ncbi:unnamed protein product [Tilletia controversa]|nr:hypothetical protein CF336_g5421 [Tilletia laevis]KAE8193940.1 hypothetical protein CF328_g4895 [Tilletia controversa]KAE8265353.1 hypothetical protein A4X03_0g314 [Tilletia caries]KAE8195965.1 hypothetical protein CF335_g4968 [Tilletia laevis]CAD6887333.1 unnamed protein product [Tilletia caries]
MSSAKFAKIDAEYADQLETLTESQKAVLGLPYHPLDPTLIRAKNRVRRIINKFNMPVEPVDPPEGATIEDMLSGDFYGAERKGLLRELFGITDDEWAIPIIEPPFQCDYGYNVKWEKNAWWYANFGLVLLDVAEIKIGSGVLFGPNCQLFGGTHSVSLVERDAMRGRALPISIEDDCWIGGGVTVMAGVTIGQGCTIGAGSVVTKDIPAFSIAVGSPARILRSLTDEEIGEKRKATRAQTGWVEDVAAAIHDQTQA